MLVQYIMHPITFQESMYSSEIVEKSSNKFIPDIMRFNEQTSSSLQKATLGC